MLLLPSGIGGKGLILEQGRWIQSMVRGIDKGPRIYVIQSGGGGEGAGAWMQCPPCRAGSRAMVRCLKWLCQGGKWEKANGSTIPWSEKPQSQPENIHPAQTPVPAQPRMFSMPSSHLPVGV